jgi:uncharacterized membrane protein
MLIELFEFLGISPAIFMKAAFEITCLSLFFICFSHSVVCHGWKRSVREFTAGFFLTACCESLGVLSGAYVYPGFQFYVFSVPIANPASWIALVYIIIELSNRLVYGRRALQAYDSEGNHMTKEQFSLFKGSIFKTIIILSLLDSTLALVLDIIMDPLATVYNWWIWVPAAEGTNSVVAGTVDPYNFNRMTYLTTPDNPVYHYFAPFFSEGLRYPTRVFGIPLINFISWFIFVMIFTFQFRWVEFQGGWSELKKTVVLWLMILVDIPVLAILLITPNI